MSIDISENKIADMTYSIGKITWSKCTPRNTKT